MTKEDIKEVARTYPKFLKGYDDAFKYTDRELIEVLRYCMCKELGLQTMYVFDENKYICIVNSYSAVLQKVIKPYRSLTDEEKTGLVQGCIQYIQSAMSKMGVVG
jgi:hypothetical protein